MKKEELNNDLLQASKDGDLKKVKDLLEKGSNINTKGEYDETPLHWAAQRGYLEITQLLIENGADINDKSHGDITPLHEAVYHDHLEIAKLLIKKGANINAKDKNDRTPLHLATEYGRLEVVKLLFSHYKISELRDFAKNEKDKDIKSIIVDEIKKREKIKSDIKAVKKAMNVPDFEF